MTRAAALLAVLALACAGSSRSTAPPSAAQPGSPVKKEGGATAATSPLICRTERPTGSNYPRRVCYREEDLDAASIAAQDAHRRAVSSGTQARGD